MLRAVRRQMAWTIRTWKEGRHVASTTTAVVSPSRLREDVG